MADESRPILDRLLERLDGAAGPGAVHEARIRQRIGEIRRETEPNPFANFALLAALEISRDIDQSRLTFPEIGALVHRLSIRGFLERAIRQRTYLGDHGVAGSEQSIRAVIDRLAENGGAPFEVFRRRVETPVFGIVLTAHPTFGMTIDAARLLADLAAGALDHEAIDDVERRLDQERYLPPSELTLDIEHEWSLEVLDSLQWALERTIEIVLTAARDFYPDRWTELQPCLVTVASWVGYDLDGRSDITWSDTIAKRLRVKLGQLRRLERQVSALQPAATLPGLIAVAADLAAAGRAVEQQIGAIEHPTDSRDIGVLAQTFMSTRPPAIVSTAALRRQLTDIASETPDPTLALQLRVTRACARWQGLSLAHTHVRLNATQLHNAIRRQVGMEAPPSDPAHRRRYVTAINDLLSRVQPETINFAVLDTEQASAKRLFMIVQQMVKYIDAETPVRFLIAETEAAFTLLTALYFARLFDVEEHVEISPLFETADAIEHGDAILEEALRSAFYRAYVERAGRLCVQFGFSDSGRYLGQMAATFQLERLRLRLAAVLERQGLTGIQLILFNTHGESIGRGGHPNSLGDRFRYVAPPVTRAKFAESGISLKEEVSFQGGDGFALLMGRSAALAVMLAAMQAYIGPDPEAIDDPIYAAGDYAVEFFALVRQAFGGLAADPNYLVLLSAYGTNLAPRTGSRPSQRQQDGLVNALRYTEVSQLRAIPNNSCLQQLGLLANTVHGVGVARAQDPELFEQMNQLSPRFRRAMLMVDGAIAASDLDVLEAYLDLMDPETWLARSARVRSRARIADLRQVASHLERLDLNPPLAKIYRRLQRDYLLLSDGRPDLDAAPRRQTLILMHVLRLALVQRLFLLATQIPEFSPQRGVTRDGLIARLLGLEVVSVVEQLRKIFPRSASAARSGTANAEPSTYRGDLAYGYTREHETVFGPLLSVYRMIVQLGNAISTLIGAVG